MLQFCAIGTFTFPFSAVITEIGVISQECGGIRMVMKYTDDYFFVSRKVVKWTIFCRELLICNWFTRFFLISACLQARFQKQTTSMLPQRSNGSCDFACNTLTQKLDTKKFAKNPFDIYAATSLLFILIFMHLTCFMSS